VPVQAVRGATQVERDERDHVLAATRELVTEVLRCNDLTGDDVLSVFFTATRDIVSVAPALAARQLGLHEVALICAQEMWVEGSMPRVVRLLAHIETTRARAEVCNVYLHGTQTLRADVPAVPTPAPAPPAPAPAPPAPAPAVPAPAPAADPTSSR
jgi:chorismate mutase